MCVCYNQAMIQKRSQTKIKKKIWVHKARSFQEADEFDVRFWRRAGAAARFEAAWFLVGDYLKMQGKSAHELRLRRSVQKIERAPY